MTFLALFVILKQYIRILNVMQENFLLKKDSRASFDSTQERPGNDTLLYLEQIDF